MYNPFPNRQDELEMQLNGFVLLIVAALLGSTGANSPVKYSKLEATKVSSRASLPNLRENGVTTGRKLHRTSSDGQNNEERMGNGVSVIGKLKGFVSSSKITDEVLQGWAAKGKPVGKVFSRLHLTNLGDYLLENPQFMAWVKYVDDFNTMNPTKKSSVIPTLISRYGDDGLFRMVEAAKKVSATKDIAARLEAEQLQYWVAIGKSADDVFNVFNLAKAGKGLFTDLDFTTWIKYVDDINAKNPNKPVSTTDILIKHYNEDALAKLILLAKNTEATKSVAVKLETAQFNDWINHGKSADDVFKLLNLDKSVVPKSGNAATKLQTSQIQRYLAEKESPDEVFWLLGLENEAENVFKNPLFSSWMNYLNVFNKQNPKKQVFWYRSLERHIGYYHLERMIDQAMRNPSTEKIARIAQDKRLKVWLRRGYSPKKAFTLLYLEKTGDGLFDSPNFAFWTKYVNDYNRRSPTEKTTTIDTLLLFYKKYSLFQMVEKARKVSSTEKIATDLQLALLNNWVRAKQTPEDVAKMLKIEISSPLMTMYARKFNRVWEHVT
ncbi:unnamed protein product [Phytophthora fragariaefolia]|uniref:Unnamed protein product n=1 Tax=Phytophthora fragariaefolia TaxID=1490495 RepID=A0A9W6Y8L5_9STRA|nr:unnamed protein product [Phytophthora fragariaefolia]